MIGDSVLDVIYWIFNKNRVFGLLWTGICILLEFFLRICWHTPSSQTFVCPALSKALDTGSFQHMHWVLVARCVWMRAEHGGQYCFLDVEMDPLAMISCDLFIFGSCSIKHWHCWYHFSGCVHLQFQCGAPIDLGFWMTVWLQVLWESMHVVLCVASRYSPFLSLDPLCVFGLLLWRPHEHCGGVPWGGVHECVPNTLKTCSSWIFLSCVEWRQNEQCWGGLQLVPLYL